MPHDHLLLCTVTIEGDRLVSACTSCGWVSAPAESGQQCGTLWDEHRAERHAFAPRTSA